MTTPDLSPLLPASPSSSSASVKSSRSIASWAGSLPILRSRSSAVRSSPKAPPVARFASEPCVPSTPPEASSSSSSSPKDRLLPSSRSPNGRRPATAPASRSLTEAHSRRISSIFSPVMSGPSPSYPRQPGEGNAMVHLSLVPHKGNHARHFPHAGYLGLSPVIVAGTVKTTLKGNMTHLDAGKVVVRVRCYEGLGSSARQIAGGGIGGSRPGGGDGSAAPSDAEDEDSSDVEGESDASDERSASARKVAVLWETEQVLWEAPRVPNGKGATQWEWAPLGDLQKEFRLVIPANAVHARPAGEREGAAGSMTFKGWKVWWQVETVVFHRPFGMSGSKVIKSHMLRLVNYALAPPIPLTTPAELPPTEASTSQGSNARLTAKVHAPIRLTAGDLARVHLSLSPSSTFDLSTEGPITIKKVVLALERTITMDVSVDKQEGDLESRRWRSVSPADVPPSAISLELVRMAEKQERTRSASPGATLRPAPSPRHAKRLSISGVMGGLPESPGRSSRGGSPAPAGPSTTTSTTMVAVAELHGPLGSVSTAAAEGAGWQKEVGVAVPKPRSTYHYALGETCRTTFGSVKFHLVARITFKTRHHGAETIETVPMPIEVGSVPRADRQLANLHLSRLIAPSAAPVPPPVPTPPEPIAVPAPNIQACFGGSGTAALYHDAGDPMQIDGALDVQATPRPPSVSTEKSRLQARPTSSHNVRRRSEASDAVDAPNRRRPRSAASDAKRRPIDSEVPELPDGRAAEREETGNRPRTRTVGSASANSVAGRRIRPYPRPKSSSSQRSGASLTSWSASDTSSSLGMQTAPLPSSNLSWRSPSSNLSHFPMQVDSPEASPALLPIATPIINPPYPSPPEESPAINFGAFTLSGSDSPALSTNSRPRQKYRGPFDKRSPVIAPTAVFVVRSEPEKEVAPEVVTGLLPPSIIPTPPSSAGSSSDNPPMWDPSSASTLSLSSAASTEASEVTTPLDPIAPPLDACAAMPGSPDLSKQERKGSHKWSVFFRRASTFSKGTPTK